MSNLVEILNFILDFFVSNTNNFGISIILFCISINLLLLPLVWVGNIFKKIEKKRKSFIQPLLDEIKDLKNKQEKYYYTKEIYRQNNYHPLYIFSNLFGIFIQVPFYIAVYILFIEYEPFQDKTFGLIQDLSLPDGLFHFYGYCYNMLPVLMASINIIYVWFTSKKQNEKIQQAILAVGFLILLYDMPSSLLIYWITSNLVNISNNYLTSSKKLIPLEKKIIQSLKKINIKKDFFYLLLFSIIPILSFYLTNIGEVSFSRVNLLIAGSVLAFLLTYLFAIFSYVDYNKRILFCYLSLSVIFTFGHLRDFFLVHSHNNISFYFFILIHFLFASCLYFLIHIQKTNINRVVIFLNRISLSVFGIILIQILIFNTNNISTLSFEHESFENKTLENTNQYPDIYFIILDAYSNSKVLNSKFGFDNNNFENYLKSKGFFIAEDSRSNYVMTFLSLSSNLNFEYINYLKDEIGVKSYNKLKPLEMINNSKVLSYLDKLGYTSVNLKSGWGKTNLLDKFDFNLPQEKYFDDFTITFLQTTLFRIVYNRVDTKIKETVLNQFRLLSDLKLTNSPFFIFSHIVSPHPPYVFNQRNSSKSNNSKFNNNFESDTLKYLNQLMFINDKTIKTVDNILKKDRNSIIIIQSDHGSALSGNDFNNPNSDLIIERSKIFNAIYLNGYDESGLYSKMSSVNTFRIIFNSIFNEDFKILKDSTFFSSPDLPYDFQDVTNFLK